MKIAILGRALTNGGVRLVVDNLLERFDEIKSVNITFLTDDESYLNKYKNIKVVIKKGNVLVWDYVHSFNILKEKRFDAILYPKGSIPFSHMLLPSKKYFMCHDLAYFENSLKAYPFRDTVYMKVMLKFSCIIADKIFAISEYTKKTIVDRFSVKKEKVIVTHLGLSSDLIKEKERINRMKSKELPEKFDLPRRYIFYSGSISPRKNLKRSLEAFNDIKDDYNIDFVMTGRAAWGNSGVYEYLEKNNLRDRVHVLGFVSSSELALLYANAEILVFPSLYEGFGLPIIEAQLFNCPVITSNTTSCEEVAGVSAITVNPYSVTDISNVIRRVLNDNSFREDLIKRGSVNIRRYSFDKMSEEIISAISSDL